MSAKYGNVPPLSPNQWEQFLVEAAPPQTPVPPFDLQGEERRIPIVGSQHMGVNPYKLTTKLMIKGEPQNEHDDTALVVLDNWTSIGYIPKLQKHWLASVHPSVWNKSEGFVLRVDPDAWGIQLLVPLLWIQGYHACNEGFPHTDRAKLATVRERNWWLAGYEAADAYNNMLS